MTFHPSRDPGLTMYVNKYLVTIKRHIHDTKPFNDNFKYMYTNVHAQSMLERIKNKQSIFGDTRLLSS